MIFSQTAKVGIKSVIYIAVKSMRDEMATIKEIGKEIDENEHTLAKVLQILSRQGIISSMKGPAGGFFVETEQMQLPLYKIVHLIDGVAENGGCVLGLKTCDANNPCPVHQEYVKAKKILDGMLQTKTIGHLANEVQKGLTQLI